MESLHRLPEALLGKPTPLLSLATKIDFHDKRTLVTKLGARITAIFTEVFDGQNVFLDVCLFLHLASNSSSTIWSSPEKLE